VPIFDFRCRQCGHKFDIIISYAEKDKVRCPECSATNPIQQLSSFNTARPGPGVSKPAPDGCNACAAAGTGG